MPIGNNLYPPVVDNEITAFIIEDTCKLYFSLSRFNNINDIKNYAFFSLKNTKTGKTVFMNDKKISYSTIMEDTSIIGDNKYYIIISQPGDKLINNTTYSVQIQFVSKNAVNPELNDFEIYPGYNPIIKDSWLKNNNNFLSEWSSVTFIKPILKPFIIINNFNESSGIKIINQSLSNISGNIKYEIRGFPYQEEEEKLKKYLISIMDSNKEKVYNSGWIYCDIDNENQIIHLITQNTQREGTQYQLIIECETENGYKFSSLYNYRIIKDISEKLFLSVDCFENNQDASIDITVKSNHGKMIGNFIISRASGKDTTDFSNYEDIQLISLTEPSLSFTWKDYTAESGIFYKYGVQRIDEQKNRSSLSISDVPCILDLDNSYLIDKNRKLKIIYNSSISSIQSTFLDTKIDTIGSKYPFIIRTGAVGYKQFSISGLITFFCNEEGYFLNDESLYNGQKEYYDLYNNSNNIGKYRDFIGEKIFREKVIDFLQDGKVKLFKSGTEGNILVRLMDISFTPEHILNRMIYTFSATAYEVDECSIKNYIKYNIQDFGEEKVLQKTSFLELGQSIVDETFWNGDVISNIVPLENIIYPKNVELKDKIIKPKSIKWFRINFNSKPKPIICVDNIWRYDTSDNYKNENRINGNIFFFKEKPIIVPYLKEYVISGEDIGLLDLFFYSEDCFTIDYVCEMEIEKYIIINEQYSNYSVETGQIQETLNPNDDIFNMISKKYNSIYSRMYSLNSVEIEALPGAVFYIKDMFDKVYEKHIIGETGILKLYNDNIIIIGFNYCGIKFNRNNSSDISIKENEYTIINQEFENESSIANPKNNGVYSLSGKKKIYYNKEWYTFNEEEELAFIPCPVIINYIYDLAILKEE